VLAAFARIGTAAGLNGKAFLGYFQQSELGAYPFAAGHCRGGASDQSRGTPRRFDGRKIGNPNSVLSTLLGDGKTTERLLVRISIETHKTSPDFEQTAADKAKNRIKQALGDIGCDVFIETDR
jgi:hypothetical protein